MRESGDSKHLDLAGVAGLVAGPLIMAFGTWLYICSRKPFWFDELSTLFVVSQGSIAAVWATMAADGQPPLGELLVRIVQHLPIPLEIAARLPGLLAIMLGAACVYCFLRRQSTQLMASLAAASFLLGRAFLFSTDLRPYALVIGFSALAILAWQRAAFGLGNRRVNLILLTLAAGLLCLSNSYGVFFAVIPVGCAETVRIVRRKMLDWGVIASVGVGLLPLIIALKNAPRVRATLLSHMPPGSRLASTSSPFHLLTTIFAAFRAPALIVFGIFVVWRLVSRRPLANPAAESGDSFTLEEWVAASGFILAGISGWIVTALSTHYYFSRYGAAMIVGVSLLFGMLNQFGGQVRRGRAILCSCCMCLVFVVDALRSTGLHNSSPEANSPAPLLRSIPLDGDPIVTASALVAWPLYHYASVQQRQRMIFIEDETQTERTGDSGPEVTLIAYENMGKPVIPMTSLEWLGKHDRFYVISNSGLSGEWLPGWLESHGYHKTVIADQVYQYSHYQAAP